MRCATHDHMPSRPRYSVPEAWALCVPFVRDGGRRPGRVPAHGRRRPDRPHRSDAQDRRAPWVRRRDCTSHSDHGPRLPVTRPLRHPGAQDAGTARGPRSGATGYGDASPSAPGARPPSTDFVGGRSPPAAPGTRLWPLSRAGRPKFLLDLTGPGAPCCSSHLRPARAAVAGDGILVVTGRRARGRRRGAAARARRRRTCSPSPPRATRWRRSAWPPPSLERRDPGAVLGSFAADHVIGDAAAFRGLRARGGRGRPAAATSSRSASSRPTRRPASATSASGDALAGRRRPARARGRASSSRSRTPPRPAPTWRRGSTAGTPACSSSGRRCCSTCWPSTSPSSPRGLRRSLAAGRPRPAGARRCGRR